MSRFKAIHLAVLFLQFFNSVDSSFYNGAVTITFNYLRSTIIPNPDDHLNWGYTSIAASSCENIAYPPYQGQYYLQGVIGVIATDCVMVYFKPECQGSGRKITRNYYDNFYYSYSPYSFRSCDEKASKLLPFKDERIRIYWDENFMYYQEDRIITDANCRNLPYFFQKEASSIKIPFCIDLYKDNECSGSSLKLEKGEYPRLKDYNFNDALVSYKPCDPKDILRETPHQDLLTVGNQRMTKSSGEAEKIKFFRNPNFKGLLYSVQINSTSCQLLPEVVTGSVKSIQITNCIFLFSSTNCNSKSAPEKPGFGFKLFPNTREAAYLPKYLREIRSFRACKNHEDTNFLSELNTSIGNNRIRP